MLKIGLTGGIGSGKTVVAEIFQVLGIPVFDADKQARLLMENDELLVTSIQKEFGAESYSEGKLNRAFVANIVFNDPFKLSILNSLVHPAIIYAADRWMHEQRSPYVIKEAALMFESGSAGHLNYIIGVTAPKHLRIKRVMARDHLTTNQVEKRMSQQIQDEIKMKLCDFVINNDELNLLIPQVLDLHEKFLNLSLYKN